MTAKWKPFWVPFEGHWLPLVEEGPALEPNWHPKWLKVEICGACGNECFPWGKRYILRVWGARVSQKGTLGRTREAPGAQTGAPGAPGGQTTVFEHIFWWIATPGAGERGGGGARGSGLKPRLRHGSRPLKEESKVW